MFFDMSAVCLQFPAGHGPRACHQLQRYNAPGDKVIYSQIDMTRKTYSGSPKGRNHVKTTTVNPTYSSEDPSSWAPLLGNRNQPESSL